MIGVLFHPIFFSLVVRSKFAFLDFLISISIAFSAIFLLIFDLPTPLVPRCLPPFSLALSPSLHFFSRNFPPYRVHLYSEHYTPLFLSLSSLCPSILLPLSSALVTISFYTIHHLRRDLVFALLFIHNSFHLPQLSFLSFQLKPPKDGWSKKIGVDYQRGGEYGNRGTEINALITRCL